jgi:hypothetical protein
MFELDIVELLELGSGLFALILLFISLQANNKNRQRVPRVR